MKNKILSKLLKFLDQPGRLIFFKGNRGVDITYDSYSYEYLLLVNEKVRDELVNFPMRFKRNPIVYILLSPFTLFVVFILALRLFLANQIINSITNSKYLVEKIHEEIQKNNRS